MSENKKMTEILPEAKAEITPYKPGEIFMSIQAFTDAQRMVAPLAKSDLVPDVYRNNIGNCLIALETAQRIGASPLMVMQNLYIVHGKPAWSSQFLVACVNASGKFSPLRYRMTGEKGKDSYGCVAWALDRKNGETLESPEVTVGMAKREGWFSKNGSKWQTMPELMLRYRAATLFARLFSPELTMGIQTAEEIADIQQDQPPRASKFNAVAPAKEILDAEEVKPETELEKVQKLLDKKGIPMKAEDIADFVKSKGDIFAYDMVAPCIDALAEKIIAGDSEVGK